MQRLLDLGVPTRRGVHNAHQEPAYAGKSSWSCGPDACLDPPGHCARLAASERARDTTILLPLYNGMTEEDQVRVLAACGELG